MASFKSPNAPRVISLTVAQDGTWKVISDLTPAEVHERLTTVLLDINAYATRVASGEPEPDEDDETGE